MSTDDPAVWKHRPVPQNPTPSQLHDLCREITSGIQNGFYVGCTAGDREQRVRSVDEEFGQVRVRVQDGGECIVSMHDACFRTRRYKR